MASKQLSDRIALLCDDCETEIFVDKNMVMINDELWQEIVDEDKKESYCDCCIEKRISRPIEIEDLKKSTGVDFSGIGHIMCNMYWMHENRPHELSQIMKGV